MRYILNGWVVFLPALYQQPYQPWTISRQFPGGTKGNMVDNKSTRIGTNISRLDPHKPREQQTISGSKNKGRPTSLILSCPG
ncbi:hypothetical protein EDD21DRAFT_223988 [Dissophora ornata]|nr:hypothetical protein EDD21DRAFT_223988 [Dissophora ornata]